MSVLYDGKQYLIQKYAIALTPGLKLLAPQSLQHRRLKALAAGVSKAHSGFGALVNVEDELNQVKAKISGKKLLNNNFTTTALQLQLENSDFPIVHLATHGEFSSQADKTFILAWDQKISVKVLSELLQDRNPSPGNVLELLVLSACQTAAGDKHAALGLAGVAARAGARSTLASLWSVKDKSTAFLMTRFYQNLATHQVSKAEALRLAQLDLLNSYEYQKPFYWTPYVLVGNWL